MRVTKDGSQIFDIDDGDDSVKAAAAKGYVPVIEMSKDGQTWHDVIGNEDSITAAIGKGYKPRQAAKTPDQYSKTESTLRGAGSGFTFGLDDEAGGLAGSLMGKGSYEEVRDRIREQKKDAQDQNPWSYGLGEVAGSAVLPIGAGGAAKTVAGAVLKGAATGAATGAISGYGNSEADNLKDSAVDIAAGGVIGGAGGALVGGVANVAGRALSKAGRDGLSAEMKSFQAGKKAPIDESLIPGVDRVVKAKNAIAETFKASKDVGGRAALANDFKKHIGPGHFRDMSDPEVIVLMAEEGNDQAINFIAQQSSLGTGVDAEDVVRLYKAGASQRNAARNFDFDQAGGELAGKFDQLGSDLKTAASKRTGELNEAARNSYIMRESDPTEAMDALRGLVKKGREHKGTVGNLPSIEAASDILENGSESIPGLSKRSWNEISDQEMYDRLQAAREYLGDNIKFSTQQGLSKAARESQNAYHAIGKVLKFDPDKMEADSVWTAYKRLEEGLLDQLDVNGKVDKYKVGNSLKDTQTAKRFRDNMALLDDFVSRPGLPAEIRDQVTGFRDEYSRFLDTADLKRAIQKFEKDVRGVSGQAVERAASLARGDDILAERIKAPAQGLLSSEQMVKAAEKYYGKPYGEMSAQERRVIVNYQVAVKKNPDMTFLEAVKKWGGQ